MAINRIAERAARGFAADRQRTRGINGVLVLMPGSAEQAAMHGQLYQLAVEMARRALAPPRHHQRFFSVWN